MIKKWILVVSFFVLIASCLLLFVACNSVQNGLNPGPPQGAKDALIKEANKYLEKEGKDFKIICSHVVMLDDADKANGVTEKWCSRISYRYLAVWAGNGNDWMGVVRDTVLSKRRGVWKVEFLTPMFKCAC